MAVTLGACVAGAGTGRSPWKRTATRAMSAIPVVVHCPATCLQCAPSGLPQDLRWLPLRPECWPSRPGPVAASMRLPPRSSRYPQARPRWQQRHRRHRGLSRTGRATTYRRRPWKRSTGSESAPCRSLRIGRTPRVSFSVVTGQCSCAAGSWWAPRTWRGQRSMPLLRWPPRTWPSSPADGREGRSRPRTEQCSR